MLGPIVPDEEGKPELLPEPDFAQVIKLCQSYIDQLDKEKYVDDDLEHYIFEAAIAACFGKDVWKWVNKRL